jgi:general secretion pathway protein D
VLAKRISSVVIAVTATLSLASCQNGVGQNGGSGLVSKDQPGSIPWVPREKRPNARQGLGIQPDSPLQDATYQEGTGQTIGRGGRPARRAGDGDVTLNLVGVPIPRAAKSVLGDMLGLNYTIDPRLTVPVTVQTSQPVSRDEVIQLFEASLRNAGASIVESNGVYRIIPTDQAATSLPRIRVNNERPSGTAIGTTAQVVQLKYISASDMKRVLDPMAPPGSVVRADDARNVIVLQGGQNELSAMLEAVQIFDVDVMRGMSMAVVPVRTSSPETIADELRTLFGADRDGPTRGVVQFIPNRRLGAILVISPNSGYVTRARSVIQRLDSHAQTQEKQLFTYPVQNRPSKELADILQSVFAREIGTNAVGGADPSGQAGSRAVAPRFGTQTLRTGNAAGGGSGLGSGAGGGSVFGQTLQQAQAGQQQQPANRPSAGGGPLVPLQEEQAAPNGRDPQRDEPRLRIVADDANNALLIFSSTNDYKRVKRVIENLDVVPNQVLIEATIAEVTLNDDLKFGVRWYFQNRNQVQSATFTNLASGAVSSVFPGFSYALRALNAQITLDALNEITNVNVVSSPSLMVLDNRTATLQIGDQVPVATQSGTFTTGAVVNSITFKDTGVILNVTPRINDSGRVLLEIEQEVSSVVKTTTSGIDSPTIRQRRVRTTVVVNDGEALALGGIIQDQGSQGSEQIPILGDIPLIGNAFKQKTNGIRKTELLIVITPRVVRDQNEARRVTEEYRRNISVNLPHTRTGRPTIGDNVRRVLQ